MKSNVELAQTATPCASSSKLPSNLKEIQGSFALEGIHISDERMLKYGTEVEAMRKSGEARRKILQALAKNQHPTT
jgi:hypothetical protein